MLTRRHARSPARACLRGRSHNLFSFSVFLNLHLLGFRKGQQITNLGFSIFADHSKCISEFTCTTCSKNYNEQYKLDNHIWSTKKYDEIMQREQARKNSQDGPLSGNKSHLFTQEYTYYTAGSTFCG
jgi:hypothetical protein